MVTRMEPGGGTGGGTTDDGVRNRGAAASESASVGELKRIIELQVREAAARATVHPVKTQDQSRFISAPLHWTPGGHGRAYCRLPWAGTEKLSGAQPLETPAASAVASRLALLSPPQFSALLSELARDNHAFRCVVVGMHAFDMRDAAPVSDGDLCC